MRRVVVASAVAVFAFGACSDGNRDSASALLNRLTLPAGYEQVESRDTGLGVELVFIGPSPAPPSQSLGVAGDGLFPSGSLLSIDLEPWSYLETWGGTDLRVEADCNVHYFVLVVEQGLPLRVKATAGQEEGLRSGSLVAIRVEATCFE